MNTIRMASMTPDEISSWTTRKSALANNRGGCRWGIPATKCFQALVYWVTDCHRRGLAVTEADFTAAVRDEYLELVRIAVQNEETEDKTEIPPALKDKNWEDWCILLQNYLMAQKSVDNIPLYYVIHPNLAVGVTIASLSRDQQLVYAAPLTGPAFNVDNKKVFRILNSLTVGENATNWISSTLKRTQNGRAAMQALRDHYDGTDGRYKRKTQAAATLEVLHYSHEHAMPFQTFSSKMKKAFDTLAICDPPGVSDSSQVQQLLDKIKTTNSLLIAAIANIRMNHVRYNTFDKAAMELSLQIAVIFPSKSGAGGGGRHRKRSAADMHRGGGGDKGYKIIKKNGRETVNGVDVTDRTREFPPEDWRKLPRPFRSMLNRMPERKAHNLRLKRNAAALAAGRDGTEDPAATVSLSDETRTQLINATARAVMSVNQASGATTPPPSTVQMPRMGAGQQRQRQNAATNRDASSVVSELSNNFRFDRDGNIIS